MCDLDDELAKLQSPSRDKIEEFQEDEEERSPSKVSGVTFERRRRKSWPLLHRNLIRVGESLACLKSSVYSIRLQNE